jgi:hypothetical protein
VRYFRRHHSIRPGRAVARNFHGEPVVERPWRLRPSRTRFVTSPRIGYASRPNGQLTAEVSHLLDPQPCWLLPGLSPAGMVASLAAPRSQRLRRGLLLRRGSPCR